MAHRSAFKIDLTEIEGDGEFPCPSCEEMIYPEDDSGVIYDVIGIKTDEDDMLEEVLVLCKKCGSIIFLAGFELLNDIDILDDLFGLDEYLTNRTSSSPTHQ